MSLSEHRKAIDVLDCQIVKLLNERAQHVLTIGEIKSNPGESSDAAHRESMVLQKICRNNKGPITNKALRAIYREIMWGSLALEKALTVAYLGPEATFTHQAAIQKFGHSLKYSAQKTISDVFTEVGKGRADYGVVPVENSTEGVVTNTLDMFADSDLKIVAQIVMPIQHCLLSPTTFKRIKRLYSHPQPLGQCRLWVQNKLSDVEIVEASSTTRAAALAAKDKQSAAIASELAAERYKLKILEKDLQDNTANITRFLVLGRQFTPPTGQDKTSLLLNIRHEVGALYKAISPFHKFRLNMTKIESRPSKQKAWEYFFFIDCDGHMKDTEVANAIRQLEGQCKMVKVLGSYPKSE